MYIDPLLDWSVTDSPLFSVHCLIKIYLHNNTNHFEPPKTVPNIRRAVWMKFQNNEAWEVIMKIQERKDARSVTQNFYVRIRLASHTVLPIIGKIFPKQGCRKELSEARDKTRGFFKIDEKMYYCHLTAWQKARAKVKQIQRINKKENWGKCMKSINSDTHVNKVWDKIESLKGKFQRNLHILQVGGQTYQDTQSIADKIGHS